MAEARHGEQASARRRTLWMPLVAAAMVALAVALRFGGALEPTTSPEEGTEPGLVRAGSLLTGLVPVTELAMTAATLTIGALLVTVVFLPSERGRRSARPGRAATPWRCSAWRCTWWR